MLNNRTLNLSLEQKLMQRGQGNEARVDFKEVTKRRSAFAASKSIRAQGGQSSRHPPAHEIRERLQIIRGGHKNAGSIGEALGHVRHSRLLGWMQKIPTL